MSASYASALTAARDAAASQHYPQGALYVVATPIGNLADISLRALHLLQLADTVACEDTRHTQALLRAYGIDKPAGQLLAVHQHNEAEAAQAVVERLRAGQRVAYASDAGTPAVSDPGSALVAAVAAAGYRVVPVPGASAAVAALSVAGDAASRAFSFHGFLPAKPRERGEALAQLLAQPGSQVLFEAPHRISDLLGLLAQQAPGRRLTLCRELTKQFEQVHTLEAAAAPAWLAADPQRGRGEFVVVVHACAATPADEALPAEAVRALELLLAELPLKQAVALAAQISGAARNALYSHALQWRERS